MRLIPWRIKASASTWFAACDGCTLSQNTYWVALLHVPGDLGLHKNTVVSTVPVPQHPLAASVNPATHITKKDLVLVHQTHYLFWYQICICILTIIRRRFDNIIKGLENIKDNNLEFGKIFLKLGCSRVDLFVECLSICVDVGDTTTLVSSKQCSCCRKTPQWWQWSHTNFSSSQPIQILTTQNMYNMVSRFINKCLIMRLVN